jgi:hypothetical protein
VSRARSDFAPRAAAAAALASVGYGVPQILQVLGMLHDPWDRILIFAPSLLLAPCFVAAMAVAVDLAPSADRGTARAAFGIATMYAVLVSIVYVVQLGVIIPGDLDGEGALMRVFACCSYRMPMTAIDLLGYTLMSVSMGVLAMALASDPGARRLRLWLWINAALAPALLGQLYWPSLIWIGALWLVTFPVAMWLLRRRLLEEPPLQ